MWFAMEAYGWLRELFVWTGAIFWGLTFLVVLSLIVGSVLSVASRRWQDWRLRRWQRALRSTPPTSPGPSSSEEDRNLEFKRNVERHRRDMGLL
jgi:hypothetical protein